MKKFITVDVIYGTEKLTTFDGNQYKEVISKFAELLKLSHSINKILEFLEKKVRGETLFAKSVSPRIQFYNCPRFVLIENQALQCLLRTLAAAFLIPSIMSWMF